MNIEKLKNVYQCLEDRLSKDIFIAQINAMITGENAFFLKNGIEALRVSGNGDLEKELVNKKIVLFGAGVAGETISRALLQCGYNVLFFCDNDEQKHGQYLNGIKIHPVAELAKYKNDKDITILVTIYCFYAEVKKQLEGLGIKAKNIPKSLCEFANLTYFTFTDFFKYGKEEIFVDCGVYDGNDVRKFINTTKNCYKKIVAFEPDPSNFENCIEALKDIADLEMRNEGVFNANETIKFASGKSYGSLIDENGDILIPTVRLDDVLGEDGCTFIKMDIEGAELGALQGAEETIKKCKPKLAISVYHKPDDIYELLLYLKKLVPEYRFWMRHYFLAEADIVLFAQAD